MSHGHESINRIVATLADGRTIAKGVTTEIVYSLGYLTVIVPNLRYIEEVLNIQWHTDPPVNYCDVGNKTVTGNVVGLTISGVAEGTTLTLEIIAIGV